MLARSSRLRKKKEFDHVFINGQSSFNGLLGIKSCRNELDTPRFGIIVSTKVSKNAVTRNRIKRRLRSIMGMRIAEFNSSADMIIIVLPTAKFADIKKLEKSVLNNLKRLHLL